ncbi:unnamed protein product [Blepharisma stoltei]|uniref:Uncharacterized protein n=1 Tax=Blepharisma stoltei TaxID=1481888 RepID=A0AAU9IYP3_9CILI|nr:unnamed protein product [Blepharisma stoltei]
MRPTDLHFRSPKERTPDHYNPNLTYDGRSLSIPSRSRKQLFAKSKRFGQYDFEYSKTDPCVGPGSYLSSTTRNRVKGVVQIKPLIVMRNTISNGFTYVGNTLVYDPLLLSKKQRKLDQSFLNDSTRSTVASFKALSHKSSPRDPQSASPLKASLRNYSPQRKKQKSLVKSNLKTIEKVLNEIEKKERVERSKTLGLL